MSQQSTGSNLDGGKWSAGVNGSPMTAAHVQAFNIVGGLLSTYKPIG